ncbi:helix-turn-helix domain-containing protein [Geopsychrobacter electrodiphilus]|uniref:helix-turn-helix domain-containing protein n=1 Tax=Geopsychrobacter electrodiphilus TaxID=225196 RepID=UPI000361DAEF|nr:cupin domain-containing protein [Geopsychrobacter electrodiphilus]
MDEFRAEVKELRIGPQIRELRQARRMTLQDLSTETELSKPLLSQIENEQVIPPLATLLRISKALKAPLHTFFEEEDNTQKCLIIRAGDTSPLNRRPKQGGTPQPYRYHSLAYGKKHKHMEPFMVEFDPHQAEQTHAVQHPGEEFLYLLEGQLQLHHADDTYLIEAGDSVYWDSSDPHSLTAVGDKIARAIAVFYTSN